MTTRVEPAVRTPFHPVLIAITIGALATSLILDIATRLLPEGSMSLVEVSYRLVGLGIVGGLALATITALDLRKIPHDSPEIDATLTRLAIDLAVVLLFILNFFWREITAFNTEVTIGQIVLSGLAIAGLAVAFARRMTTRRA